jgi:hypothetical protein
MLATQFVSLMVCHGLVVVLHFFACFVEVCEHISSFTFHIIAIAVIQKICLWSLQPLQTSLITDVTQNVTLFYMRFLKQF